MAALACFAALAAPAQEANHPAAPFAYLPPSWCDRVVFYHSFEQGIERPEINLANVTVQGTTPDTPGFAGRAYAIRADKRLPLRLSSPALSPHRPFTLMAWWRLDEPMREDLTFCLLYLTGHGRPGYVANAVHGKSHWCALSQPTYISQVYGFPGIRNHHNSWGGRVWPEVGQWHHVALAIPNPSTLQLFWDGNLRETIALRGRPLAEGDLTTASFGEQYSRDAKPDAAMTFDEVILTDRALTDAELAQYVLATRSLAARAFPVR
jgi:hypothetical protein